MYLIVVGIDNFTSSEPPKIVGVGTPFNLSCDPPDAKPEPDLRWMFNDKIITIGGTYKVLAANLNDTGLYTCIAKNIAGRKELLVNVTVLGMLLFIIFNNDDLTLTDRPVVTINNDTKAVQLGVQLGSTAVLNCSSPSPYVTSISWSHNGTKLESEGNKIIVSSANGTNTLTIMDIDEDDFGEYNCTISDSIHPTDNRIAVINHTGEYVIITLSLCLLLCVVCVY